MYFTRILNPGNRDHHPYPQGENIFKPFVEFITRRSIDNYLRRDE